jgi:tRNA(Ile)-lysidine synthetase-like protein
MQIIKNENNDYPKCNLKNNISIIRYNNQLYIVNQSEKRKQASSLLWDIKNDIKFGESTIYIDTLKNEGIYDCLCLKAPITLKSFIGNERIMLNQYNHQNLKKLFQTKSIPKWERDDFVLFYAQNELLLAYSDNNKFISSQLR